MLPPGHRGDDAQLVTVLDRRGQVVEVADVLVVEIDVDEAAHLAVVEQALGDAREPLPQVVQKSLDGSPLALNNRLALGVLAQRRGNVNPDGHGYTSKKLNIKNLFQKGVR